jgi:hypothetical protein
MVFYDSDDQLPACEPYEDHVSSAKDTLYLFAIDNMSNIYNYMN